jgi:hypothetical protein
MTILSDILGLVGSAVKSGDLGTVATAINAKLATGGTSLSDLGGAAQAVMKDLEANPEATLAKIATDGLEIAFPEFALFIAIGGALLQNSTPAQWNDPVLLARDRNPNAPGYIMGEGN